MDEDLFKEVLAFMVGTFPENATDTEVLAK